MGVEVQTERLWDRADSEGLARLVFVNMLDRERADFFRALDSLKEAFGAHAVATEIPIGSEHEVRGVIDLIDMKAFEYEGEERGNAAEVEIPDDLRAQAEEYREKLMDEVAENSDELMERYLEGEEISHEEIVTALKKGVTEGHLFPVTCGVATKNLGTNRLLEALVEDVPSPAMRGAIKALDADGEEIEIEPDGDGDPVAYVFKTTADPYTGRINLLRVYSRRPALGLAGVQRHPQGEGADRSACLAVRQGDLHRGRARRRGHRRGRQAPRDARGGRPGRQGRRHLVSAAGPPRAGDGVRVRAQVEGRRGQGGGGHPPAHRGGPDARRPPRPGDRRADHRRAHPDPRRGGRRSDEAALRGRDRAPPAEGALPGDDPQARQGPRPLQEADRRARAVRRLPHRDRAGRGREPDSSSSTRSRAA